MIPQKVKSSFRDPGSQVLTAADAVYRHIRSDAVPHYRRLMDSGLYASLAKDGSLVAHRDVTAEVRGAVGAGAGDVVIQPQKIPMISYPFEWSFSALKAAALLTLDIQRRSLEQGMTLQDASAYNVQFFKGKPVFIDTGSFRVAEEGKPWEAYRQFCQHFLAPLLLMSYRDVRLGSLLRQYLDGIPLDLAARLLPLRAKVRLPVFLHIIMHARYAVRDFSSAETALSPSVSKTALYGLIDQLQSLVRSLEIRQEKTVWTEYEDTHTYSTDEYRAKEAFIAGALAQMQSVGSVWDLGANTGHFSRLVAAKAPDAQVIAFEYDFMTVEAGYRKSAAGGNMPMHLWMDLFNPTPSLGWASEEWRGLKERGPADLVLALALVHHLCLAGNIPFDRLFSFLADIARHLIIEFVPKDDVQSRRLLKTRRDIFTHYTQADFEREMAVRFDIIKSAQLSQSGRQIYFARRRS